MFKLKNLICTLFHRPHHKIFVIETSRDEWLYTYTCDKCGREFQEKTHDEDR